MQETCQLVEDRAAAACTCVLDGNASEPAFKHAVLVEEEATSHAWREHMAQHHGYVFVDMDLPMHAARDQLPVLQARISGGTSTTSTAREEKLALSLLEALGVDMLSAMFLRSLTSGGGVGGGLQCIGSTNSSIGTTTSTHNRIIVTTSSMRRVERAQLAPRLRALGYEVFTVVMEDCIAEYKKTFSVDSLATQLLGDLGAVPVHIALEHAILKGQAQTNNWVLNTEEEQHMPQMPPPIVRAAQMQMAAQTHVAVQMQTPLLKPMAPAVFPQELQAMWMQALAQARAQAYTQGRTLAVVQGRAQALAQARAQVQAQARVNAHLIRWKALSSIHLLAQAQEAARWVSMFQAWSKK